jgi:HD-GYP domain-containing protein (c-di-GMP phosphodiesterase class II)
MDNVRLHLDELRVGVQLPFDIHDAQGHTLLRQGFVIADQDQLERLIERGAYCSAAAAEELKRSRDAAAGVLLGAHHAARPTERVSVFALLGRAREEFAALFAGGESGAAEDAAFAAAVKRTAHAIGQACHIDSDAAIASILVTRPPRYFARQAVNVAILAEILLKQLGAAEEERQSALAAALTMNLAIVDLMDLMYSQASPPSPEQREQVQKHPAAGAAALRARGIADAVWLDAVAQHHEAIDGSGYPAKSKGPEISRPAQVLSLADRYCAAITERAHRAGAHPNIALREIFLKYGQAIDPMLAAVLIREIGIYPPGAVVVLANGEIGLVVRRTLNANHPVVRSLFTPIGKRYPQPPKRLTSKTVYDIKNVAGRDKLADIPLEGLWSDSQVETDEEDPATT